MANKENETGYTVHSANDWKGFFLVTILYLMSCFLPGGPAWAELGGSCEEAWPLSLNGLHHGYRSSGGRDHEYLQLNVPAPGILSLEAWAGQSPRLGPTIDWVGSECGEFSGTDERGAVGSASRYVIGVKRPGVYILRVALKELAVGFYTLRTRFLTDADLSQLIEADRKTSEAWVSNPWSWRTSGVLCPSPMVEIKDDPSAKVIEEWESDPITSP